jgi:hypothetical protein
MVNSCIDGDCRIPCCHLLLKCSVFWDITPCSLLKVNCHIRGTYHLHLNGCRISPARNQHESWWQTENGGDMFLQNVSWLSTGYMALYTIRQTSSQPWLWEPQILHTNMKFVTLQSCVKIGTSLGSMRSWKYGWIWAVLPVCSFYNLSSSN